MCCCKPYEEHINNVIDKKIQDDKRLFSCEKNILMIGSNSCSTFYQLQQHYNMEYDRAYNGNPSMGKAEQHDIADEKLNLLIDGYINNIASLLSSSIIPSEIYQLIWQYYPKQKCLIVSNRVIRHDYKLQQCHFRVSHIHEINANYEYLNKLIHYFMPFDNFACLVYSVSLLITDNKEQFQQALELFDIIINHHSFECIATVVWFEDYNEFIAKINDRTININAWHEYTDNKMDIERIQNGKDAFVFIQYLFCDCNKNPREKQVYVFAVGKSLRKRTNKAMEFIKTWYDIHHLLIGMSLARGGLL